MLDVICQLPSYWHFAAIISIALIEAWLGNTKRVKSGSILELIIRTIMYVLKRRKQNDS